MKSRAEGLLDKKESRRKPPSTLARCSFKKEQKSKRVKEHSLITTINTTLTKKISIRIITAPEDPNAHLSLYLCIETGMFSPDLGLHLRYHWYKIDLTNDSSAPQKKSKPTIISPIFDMPEPMPRYFRLVPTKQKLVYALGGTTIDSMGFLGGTTRGSDFVSSKAFVCDFGSASTPVWEEFPAMCSPIKVRIAVASPLDGKIYAFGEKEKEKYGDQVAVVFDPATRSWAPSVEPCPTILKYVDSYCILHSCDGFAVFDEDHNAVSFDFSNSTWNKSYCTAPEGGPEPPSDSLDNLTSCVAVGDIIYRFHFGKLYALHVSRTETERSHFKLVPGMKKQFPKYLKRSTKPHLFYIGKGKFCLVWAIDAPLGKGFYSKDHGNEGKRIIKCLKFWVGTCSRRKQLRAVFDRREQYVAQGHELYDCFTF